MIYPPTCRYIPFLPLLSAGPFIPLPAIKNCFQYGHFLCIITMSLNCLTCQGMKRTDSDADLRERLCEEKANSYNLLGCVERSWSGNLVPRPNCDKVRTGSNLAAANRVKKAHHRSSSSSSIGFEVTAPPRLVRSGGLRRDWSFEDLRHIVQELRNEHK